MDLQGDVRAFLTTRRSRISPESVGVPVGRGRRVPGLRRSEVAARAGVSVEYYARLERGALGGVSEEVLHSVAAALELDEAEWEHLLDLAGAANRSRRRARRPRQRSLVAGGLQQLLDVVGGPAFVRNGRMDLLATNQLGRALYAPALVGGRTPVNLARFQFLEPAARTFYPDWPAAADTAVAILRLEAGRDPHEPALQELVGELSTLSSDFRKRWGAHDVRRHGYGTKSFCHPSVGEIVVDFHSAELVGESGLTLTVYTVEPGSPSEAALHRLGSDQMSS